MPKSTVRSAKICYKHFLVTDFQNEITQEDYAQFKFGKLKKNVVPSQYLPEDAIVVEPILNFSAGKDYAETKVMEVVIESQSVKPESNELDTQVNNAKPNIFVKNESCNSDYDHTPIRIKNYDKKSH